MGKKIVNITLFVAVLAAAIGITLYTGQGKFGVMVYNFVFLGVMAILYLAGMIGGMFRMNNLTEAFQNGADELRSVFKRNKKEQTSRLNALRGIFANKFLDEKMDLFIENMEIQENGIGDLKDYINEEEIELHVHKRLLEMVPDILTSLGILGTFVGLVWGLKNFDPGNYEAMTNSVSALVEGIKVAFMTSIYGIAFSIIYTYGVKSEYNSMTEMFQKFINEFHIYVMPSAENETRNLLISGQKTQTTAMEMMAEHVAAQMVEGFAKVITPTFVKMNESLDSIVSTITKTQTEAVKELLDIFMKEMNHSFGNQFGEFRNMLEALKKNQAENMHYTNALYQTLSSQMGDSYAKQDAMMRRSITEMDAMVKQMLTESGEMVTQVLDKNDALMNLQTKHSAELLQKFTEEQTACMESVSSVMEQAQSIQKQQQEEYRRLCEYLKEAEESSANFWSACNQTMQKYVEAAAKGMEKVSNANQAGTDALKENAEIMQEFNRRLRDFTEYQNHSLMVMDQLGGLLKDGFAAGSYSGTLGARAESKNGSKEALMHLEEVLGEQAERQEKLLEEMTVLLREILKGEKKSKFSLFK